MANDQFETHEDGFGPIQNPIEQFNSFKRQLNLEEADRRLAEYAELLQTRSRLEIQSSETAREIEYIESQIPQLRDTRATHSEQVAQLRREVDSNARLLNIARLFKERFFPEPESSELAEAKSDDKTNQSSGTTHSSISNVARAKKADGKLLKRLSSRSSVTAEPKDESKDNIQEESATTSTQSGMKQIAQADLEDFISDKQIDLAALIELCDGTTIDENLDSYAFQLTNIEAKIESPDAAITVQIEQTQRSIADIEQKIKDLDTEFNAQKDIKQRLVSEKQEHEQPLQAISAEIATNKPAYSRAELDQIKDTIESFDSLITVYGQEIVDPSYENFVALYNSIQTKAHELHGIITLARVNECGQAFVDTVLKINELKEQLFVCISQKLGDEFNRIPEVADNLSGSSLEDLEGRIKRLNTIKILFKKENLESQIKLLSVVETNRRNRRLELTRIAEPLILDLVRATITKIEEMTTLVEGIELDLRNDEDINDKKHQFAEMHRSISGDLVEITRLLSLFSIKLNPPINFLHKENCVEELEQQRVIEREREREINGASLNHQAPQTIRTDDEQLQKSFNKVQSDRQIAYIAKANLKLKIVLGCSIALMIGSALVLAALVAPQHMPQVITNVVAGLTPTAYAAILGCTISVGAISVASAGFSLFTSCRNSQKADGCGSLIPAFTGLI